MLCLNGELSIRAEQAREVLEDCQLCPRRCHVNRLADEIGKCGTGAIAIVSSYGPHFGEEAPLVGDGGSGTIFFTNCNLECVFCQNYNISQLGMGRGVTGEELASMMLSLQMRGCHNINLVSPTHVVPQILDALEIAIARGLSIPLVYNCGGYESVETLKLLEGVIDIYMPDMKYANEVIASKYSGIEKYPSMNRAAIKEMYRQVGDLEINKYGVATRGLLIRHLVLPNGLAGTAQVVRFLAEEVSQNTYLNVMTQYRPCYKAFQFPLVNRPVNAEEFQKAVDMAQQYGLRRLDGLYSPGEDRVLFL